MLFESLCVVSNLAYLALGAPMNAEAPHASSRRSDSSSLTSTFYVLDRDTNLLANANPDPSGVYFGLGRNSPTLFTIDSSTGLLLTADPDETSLNSYVEPSDYSPVQIGTAASSGFVKCSISNDELACSADDIYTQFVLDIVSKDTTDEQLYLVKSGTTSLTARNVTLGVKYGSSEPAPLPTKFHLSTSMGYAVDFAPNSGIYAGANFAKEAPGSVYTLDSSTGYLKTSSRDGSTSSPTSIAYVDTAGASGYKEVQLSPLPFPADSMTPLTCQVATDGSLVLSCQAGSYQYMWLDRASSISGDYTLYIATPDSSASGPERVEAWVKVSNCSSCS